jgi:hypothetical protein
MITILASNECFIRIFCSLRHDLLSHIFCHLVTDSRTNGNNFHNLSIDGTQFFGKQLSLHLKMAAQFIRRVVSSFIFNCTSYNIPYNTYTVIKV